MLPLRDSIYFHGPALATKALIALCILGFAFQLSMGLDASLERLALVPALLLADPLGEGYRLFTSMFTHGSLGHLLGNVWFMWVFGPALEGRLGSGRYLLLYLLAGLAAALAQTLFSDPHTPMVGASGAISGVCGGYFLLFSRAYVLTWFFPFFLLWLPASTYLGYWALIQLVNGLLGLPGVAWWAHLGGFAAGMALAWMFQPRRPYLTAPSWESWFFYR